LAGSSLSGFGAKAAAFGGTASAGPGAPPQETPREPSFQPGLRGKVFPPPPRARYNLVGVRASVPWGAAGVACLCPLGGFQVEDGVERDRAGLVLLDADLTGGYGRTHAAGEVLSLLARPNETAEGGLRLLGRRQHLILVGRNQFIDAGLLEADVVGDPA